MAESRPNAIGGQLVAEETDRTPRGTVSEASQNTTMLHRLMSAASPQRDIDEPPRRNGSIMGNQGVLKAAEMRRKGSDTPELRYNPQFKQPKVSSRTEIRSFPEPEVRGHRDRARLAGDL